MKKVILLSLEVHDWIAGGRSGWSWHINYWQGMFCCKLQFCFLAENAKKTQQPANQPINYIKDGIKVKITGNYGIDGFNQINWSDWTNGVGCVRIDRAAGSVWFHWLKLSEWMKCKHIELIELTRCMVVLGGTESGTRIYLQYKNSQKSSSISGRTKSRKVKGKDDKYLFLVQKHWYGLASGSEVDYTRG